MKELKSIIELTSSFKNFVFDMDGVLWKGNSPIPAALKAHK